MSDVSAHDEPSSGDQKVRNPEPNEPDSPAPELQTDRTQDESEAPGPLPITSNDASSVASHTAERPADVAALLLSMESRLIDAFERKVAFDQFKERQIDRLHDELQSYKSDLLKKTTRPLLSALIKLHGDIIRLIGGIEREDPTKLTVDRIVGLFSNFRDEIEDLLSDQGVHSFRDTVNDRFDARRQSSVGTVETVEVELIGRIAEHVRPGFEQGASIIDKEKVTVYVAPRSVPGAIQTIT
jgi:hypothetical protein